MVADRHRVLVVDDEPHICDALSRFLTREGYEVETISNSRTALRWLNNTRYDLILLDVKMPGMNGIELYDHMIEIDPALQQKVICITGDVNSDRNKAFLAESGIPCLTKPFDIAELMRKVKSVLADTQAE